MRTLLKRNIFKYNHNLFYRHLSIISKSDESYRPFMDSEKYIRKPLHYKLRKMIEFKWPDNLEGVTKILSHSDKLGRLWRVYAHLVLEGPKTRQQIYNELKDEVEFKSKNHLTKILKHLCNLNRITTKRNNNEDNNDNHSQSFVYCITPWKPRLKVLQDLIKKGILKAPSNYDELCQELERERQQQQEQEQQD